jgi:hypothetical protein
MIVTKTQRSQALILNLFQLFFCYVEPFMAVSGAFLATFTPESFLNTILPLSSSGAVTTIEVTPLVQYLLVLVASLYCLLAALQFFLLRRQYDSGTWRVAMMGMLAGDLGHLGAIQVVVPGYDIYWKVWLWRMEDWSNIGILFLCISMRVGYLLWSVADRGDHEKKYRQSVTTLKNA